MSGYPTVEAYNSRGHRLRLHVLDGEAFVTKASPRPVLVRPGADAEFIFANSACPDAALPEPPPRHVAYLTVGIPSAANRPLHLHISAQHLPITDVPLCPGPGEPNHFSVSPVEPNVKAAI